eukprot:4767494-Amphidinium_carterae.2
MPRAHIAGEHRASSTTGQEQHTGRNRQQGSTLVLLSVWLANGGSSAPHDRVCGPVTVPAERMTVLSSVARNAHGSVCH